MVVDVDYFVNHFVMQSKWTKQKEDEFFIKNMYLHFVLFEVQISNFDWQNIVEVLEPMMQSFYSNDLNEHSVISNQHIESKKDFAKDQYPQFESRKYKQYFIFY